HAPHAELMQFRRPQRTHAGAAEDVDALRERPQDLLVPDRWRSGKVAVDDTDRARLLPSGAIDVALRRGRQTFGLAYSGDLIARQRRPDEEADGHAGVLRMARARAPGT